MYKWMRFQSIRRNGHFITRQTSGARANKRIKHSQLASTSFREQPFYPFGGKASAIAKPPVNRKPHVVQKIGRVANNLKLRTNPACVGFLIKYIEDGLCMVLAQTHQNTIVCFRFRIFGY